jgi:hypothetical protein
MTRSGGCSCADTTVGSLPPVCHFYPPPVTLCGLPAEAFRSGPDLRHGSMRWPSPCRHHHYKLAWWLSGMDGKVHCCDMNESVVQKSWGCSRAHSRRDTQWWLLGKRTRATLDTVMKLRLMAVRGQHTEETRSFQHLGKANVPRDPGPGLAKVKVTSSVLWTVGHWASGRGIFAWTCRNL